MAYTTNPRSISASTTGPCGTSIATATVLAALAIERSQSPSSAKPSPLCGNSRSPTVLPRASRRQTWCLSEPQSTPANHEMVSSAAILSPLYNARAVTTPATPCTGARGRNFLRLGRAAARHGAPGLRRRPDPDQGDRGKLVRNDWGSSLRPGHTPWFGSWLVLSASDGQRPIGWTPSCSSGGSWGGCVGNGAIAARCAFR